MGLIGKAGLTRRDVSTFVETKILKNDRNEDTDVKGVAINIQFLRKVFGKGRTPLVFVQLPLSEIAKIPERKLLVNLMADFEQLPRHQTSYKKFLWIKFNEAKDSFNEAQEDFKRLLDSIGYDLLGQNLVESHVLIKDFDGECPDDEVSAEICTEWPYYWVLGTLFANQKRKDSWGLGDYVTPNSMKYRDLPYFHKIYLTRGWACRFNENLLKKGKIVQTSPTCFGAAKSGEGRQHPRWDLWVMSQEVSKHDARMDPSKVEGESLYRESDCVLMDDPYEEERGKPWITHMNNVFAKTTGAMHILSTKKFLSAYVEKLSELGAGSW